jgi:5-hydroxyisourate hydrolase
MAEEPHISTHVLDAETGQPRTGVEVVLKRQDGGSWLVVGGGETDDDGRIRRLNTDTLIEGMYRLEFQLGGRFFDAVALTVKVDDASRSWHVPLLLAPYSLTSYRGS